MKEEERYGVGGIDIQEEAWLDLSSLSQAMCIRFKQHSFTYEWMKEKVEELSGGSPYLFTGAQMKALINGIEKALKERKSV